MKILGIESSFDETATGVVEDGHILLSNVVRTSMEQHIPYGGVVPEIAARSHIESITPVIEESLAKAECGWQEVDAIAVTQGAGLGGSLLIGVLTARTLAIIHKKPLYAINHVEAHLYANFLNTTTLPGYKFPTSSPVFPMLGLIVSGAHSQLVFFRSHFDYDLLGQTRDDAVGEAFDKVAKLLGLPYPGGPSLSEAAKQGDRHKYKLPKARSRLQGTHVDGVQGSGKQRTAAYTEYGKEVAQPLTQQTTASSNGAASSAIRQVAALRGLEKYDLSFSGLKTAVLRLAQAEIGESYDFPSSKLSERLSEVQKADIAASFQHTAIETVVDKVALAVKEFEPKCLVIGGGVASSQELRNQLQKRLSIPLLFPDRKLCTDNGAMIAALGYFKASLDQKPADPYTLDIAPNLSM